MPSRAVSRPKVDIAGLNAETAAIFIRHSTDVLVRTDVGGMILSISSACRSWGWDPEELIGVSAISLVHPDDREKFLTTLDALATNATIEQVADGDIRYRRKDGGWVWLQGNPQVVRRSGGRREILNIFRDVSEMRQLRERQAESDRLTFLANAVPGVGFWRLDARTQAVTWSEQMFAIYGLPVHAHPPLSLAMSMIYPGDKAAADGRVAQALKAGQGWDNKLTRVIRPDGEIRYVEGQGFCEFDETGKLKAVVGTMVDVTARQRAENALADAKARFLKLAEKVPGMIAESEIDSL